MKRTLHTDSSFIVVNFFLFQPSPPPLRHKKRPQDPSNSLSQQATRLKYHSVQGFDSDSRVKLRLKSGDGGLVACDDPVGDPSSSARTVATRRSRPHSIDAEFLHQLEQMGLSQSLPPFTTVVTKN